MNLGRFQAPVYVAQRQINQYAVRAFLWNAACLEIGLKGVDRQQKPPQAAPAAAASSSSSSGPAEDVAQPAKLTLKQSGHEGWCPDAATALDKAGYLYGQVGNWHLQRVMARALTPTSEWHSRLVAVGCSVPNCLPLVSCS